MTASVETTAAPTTPLLDVVVYGKPAPQGSKSAFRNKHTGRIQQVESSKAVKPWREAVKSAVLALPDRPPRLEGPVSVHVIFTFDKPKSAPKTRRTWPTTRASGDIDKVLRSTFDAFTDVGVWKDDAQVVRVTASKVFVGDLNAMPIPGAVLLVRSVV